MDIHEIDNLGQAVMVLINYLADEIKQAVIDDLGDHNNDGPVVYTPNELAKMLKISTDLVYKKYIRQPGFPIRRVGRRILIPAEEFHQWFKEQKEKE